MEDQQMTKTKEELAELKKEFETLSGKLKELTEEELLEVFGGSEDGEQSFYLLFEAPNQNLNGVYSISGFEELIKNNRSLRLKDYSAYCIYTFYINNRKPIPDYLSKLLLNN